MKVKYSKSLKSCYRNSEIKGYEHPKNEEGQSVYTCGSLSWHNQNIEELSKKYDLVIINEWFGTTNYFMKVK